MASSSGNSIESISPSTTTASPPPTEFQKHLSSSSSEDLQLAMNERKRKRMQSNRESARRSRMRKQKHLDDLMAQATQLRLENNQILETISVTTQHFVTVEAENSVLRAQMSELSNRLESLNEMIRFMGLSGGVSELRMSDEVGFGDVVDQLMMIGVGTGGGGIENVMFGDYLHHQSQVFGY